MITKQLNKYPNEYKDTSYHPHVYVAVRMIEKGKTAESLVNHMIHYFIIKDESIKSTALRARSADEWMKDQ